MQEEDTAGWQMNWKFILLRMLNKTDQVGYTDIYIVCFIV
jgi:hypothetical protein